jgi:hypothetical protein
MNGKTWREDQFMEKIADGEAHRVPATFDHLF